MQLPESSLTEYYAARAPEYETVYAKPERQPDLRRLEEMLPGLFDGRRVLDVACGTGYWTPFIASKAKEVVGVDASAETLNVAAGKEWSLGHVRFQIADAYALPDDLGMFDAAFGGFWFSHISIEKRCRFFESLDQRLHSGAKVVFLDNLFVEGSSTPISHRDSNGNTYQRRTLCDGSEHVVLKNFPTGSELCTAAAPFGQNMQFLGLRYYWLFSYEKSESS